MNILLIVPLNEPYSTIVGADNVSNNKLNCMKIKKLYCVYPSGLLSISSYLKKHLPNVNVKILDLNVTINYFALDNTINEFEFSYQEFLKKSFALLNDFNPDIVGISALFTGVYQDLKQFAAFLRENYPLTLITCGGHLATSLYKKIFEDDIDIDAIAYGEGEIPFLNLARAKIAGQEEQFLNISPSWITQLKCFAVTSFLPQNHVIDNLDEIPPYDLESLIFPDVYFDSTSFLFLPEIHDKHKEMIFFSTRGCPNNCVFCASHLVHGKKIRSYSLDRIKSDIIFYNKRYGIDKIVFYDDHFLFKKSRAIEILQYIKNNNFIASIINPAFFSIDKEIAVAMKSAGVKAVFLSIESGNENTFKNIIHKPSSLQKANQAVELLHGEGINIATNVLIGLPGETHESIEIGLEYLKTTKFNWYSCFVAAPLPGSDLYKICLDNNYFDSTNDNLSMDFKKCVIRTDDFTPEYIEMKAYEMNLILNFLNNYDMRVGNHVAALMLFERIITTVTDSHAFAYYYAARCCMLLQLEDKYIHYKNKYEEMIQKFPIWKEYRDKFQLNAL